MMSSPQKHLTGRRDPKSTRPEEEYQDDHPEREIDQGRGRDPERPGTETIDNPRSRPEDHHPGGRSRHTSQGVRTVSMPPHTQSRGDEHDKGDSGSQDTGELNEQLDESLWDDIPATGGYLSGVRYSEYITAQARLSTVREYKASRGSARRRDRPHPPVMTSIHATAAPDG